MDHDDAPHSILILRHYEQVRKGCGFVLTRTLPEQAFSQIGIRFISDSSPPASLLPECSRSTEVSEA